jgi:hypothetical protein
VAERDLMGSVTADLRQKMTDVATLGTRPVTSLLFLHVQSFKNGVYVLLEYKMMIVI